MKMETIASRPKNETQGGHAITSCHNKYKTSKAAFRSTYRQYPTAEGGQQYPDPTGAPSGQSPHQSKSQTKKLSALCLEKWKGAYGGLVVQGKDIVHITLNDGRLASADIADNEDLVKILLSLTFL